MIVPPFSRSWIYAAALAGAVLACIAPNRGVAQDATPANATQVDRAANIETELNHAETYYWFGMAELGNKAAFNKGYDHLANVEQLVAEGSFSVDQRAAYARRIDALRTDLDEQLDIAHDTLYGIFPIFRFFAPSLFADQANTATFELIDDPRVMVTTSASKKMVQDALATWSERPQMDVIFVSVPRATALENESLYLFNSSPRFFVHNYREAVEALDTQQAETFLNGGMTPEIKNRLLEAFGLPELLVVTVRQQDVVDEEDYFFIVESRMYNPHDDEASHKLAVMGFSRDRNDELPSIVIAHLLLVAFAFGAFALMTKVRRRAATRTPLITFLLVPFLAFVVGRAGPWAIAPILRRIAPLPENLAIVSFWAPLLAGFALLAVPMLAYWIVCARLSKMYPPLAFESRGGSICVAISAGTVAYLSVPLFLYMESMAIVVIIPFTLCAALIGALLGRALDSGDQLPTGYAFLACLMAMIVGAALMLNFPIWFGMTAVVCMGGCLAILIPYGKTGADSDASKRWSTVVAADSAEKDIPSDINELIRRAERPRYQKNRQFEQCSDRLQSVLNGKCGHLILCGGRGCGLSTTSEALIQDLQKRVEQAGDDVVVMYGETSQPMGEPTPYGPFRQALAQHFEVNLLSGSEAGLQRIDNALGGLFESVVPFGSILFPDTTGDMSGAASRDNIFSSIAWMLRRLADSNVVVLAIDNIQYMDDLSSALLTHLLHEFPKDSKEPMAILVTCDEQAVMEKTGIEGTSDVIVLPFPDIAQQMQILTSGIGLTHDTATQIVERVGAARQAKSGLYWLLQVVANLARSGAFVKTDDGYKWTGEAWPDSVEIPNEMADIFRESIQRFPQYRRTLQAAACACDGREFSVSVLAKMLEMPRLELITQLDMIDEEIGVVYDVGARDDIYAFDSSYMLDVVRAQLQVSEAGPETHEVPQIVREYHARLAAILEETLSVNSTKLYDVANHYYAAGAAHAAKGMEYCVQAANAHCGVADFGGAERYIERAEECARVSGTVSAIDGDRLFIECQKAHVTGQAEERVEVARAGADFIAENPEAPLRLLLAIAQAHYDAGKSTGERKWFEEAIAIGRDVVERASSPRDEAVGRHFVGISLPRDQAAQRTTELRRALQLMEDDGANDAEDARLLGPIIGSLAEELSRGDDDEKQKANKLFHRRLALIEQTGSRDPQGLAMTHGGLGRLAFFAEPKDTAIAKQHFSKDLDISEAIGDQQGQIQMHSLLGACEFEEQNYQEALSHFDASWQMARDPISRFFAGAGHISCHAATKNGEALGTSIREVLALAREYKMPADCAESLKGALVRCDERLLKQEGAELLAIVHPDGESSEAVAAGEQE